VVRQQQQPAWFDGPDRGALLADELPDLGVLELGMILQALGTPSLSARSNAYQPARS